MNTDRLQVILGHYEPVGDGPKVAHVHVFRIRDMFEVDVVYEGDGLNERLERLLDEVKALPEDAWKKPDTKLLALVPHVPHMSTVGDQEQELDVVNTTMED